MQERVAQMVLLVRAFEEVDRDGVVLSHEQRLAASRRAVMVTRPDGGEGELGDVAAPVNEETVVRRARLLYNALLRRVPALQRVLDLARLRSLMGPAVVLTAFLFGLATHLPMARREINLLAFPLLGLLVWNLASYLLMGLFAVARRSSRSRRRVATDLAARAQDRVVTGLADWVVRIALWRSRFGWRRAARGTPGQTVKVTTRAFMRFVGLWHRLTGDLLEARVRRRLHLGAMALACGVLLGMYWRALAFEYRATWESTLLGPAQVQTLLDTVLGPAAWLLDIDVPDVGPLQAPEDGDAAPWIHLWAVTTAVVVLAPRALLAALAAWRSITLRNNLPLDVDEPYYRRVLADWRGAARRVLIAPYSFSPPPVTIESLKALLYEFFGTRAEIDVHAPLAYGSGAEDLLAFGKGGIDERTGRYLVLLFNLAQSPEAEVHGALLEQVKSHLDVEHGRLLAVLDVSAYRQRADGERLAERLRAWKRVASECGIEIAELDPPRIAREPGAADARLSALRAALWPSGDLVAG